MGVAAEDGTVTLVVTEDIDEDDDEDAGQHQYSINEDGTIEIRVKDESENMSGDDSQVAPTISAPVAVTTTVAAAAAAPAVTSANMAAPVAPQATAAISRLASQPPPTTSSKDIDDCFGFDEGDDATPNVALMSNDDEDDEGAEGAAGVL